MAFAFLILIARIVLGGAWVVSVAFTIFALLFFRKLFYIIKEWRINTLFIA